MKKIYVDNYASLSEGKLIGDVECTFQLQDSDIVVNPTSGSFMGKQIIVNLPCEVPLEQLISHNIIVSRFPIISDIPVAPYLLLPEHREEVSEEDYSCLILSPFMLMDLDHCKLVHDNKFLIGISESIDGDATLVGMQILTSNIEDLRRE